jgi:cardiolipin synthase A/B
MNRKLTYQVMAGLTVLCLLLFSTCCTRLPKFTSEQSQRAGSKVQMEDSHGPLTLARSKAIIDVLKARGASDNFLDLHLAIEEAIVDSPLTTGNQVELLQDGPLTYKAMLEAINAATDHINMETYILDDDEAGQRFAAALIAAQQRGVLIHLIRDSVGTLATPTEFFDHLKAKSIQVLEFNPVNPLSASEGWELNSRDHRKLLIVDGRVAFLGGINISSVYSGGSFRQSSKVRPGEELPWRDTHLEIQGPVVAELQKLFIQTWEKQQGNSLPAADYFPKLERVSDELVRAIGSSPDDPYSLIYATLISALRSAQAEIWITNAYFVPDPQLLESLKEAAASGVDVRLILPSSTDAWLVFNAGRSHYHELLAANVKIFERRHALLHVKSAVIDGVWSTVGSTNMDWRSFLHNQEVNVVVLGGNFGDKMRKVFLADQAQAQEITLQDWQKRPVCLRFKEQLGRLWEYWL